MAEHKPELVERCAKAIRPGERPYINEQFRDMRRAAAQAVLDASGHAELVATCKAAEEWTARQERDAYQHAVLMGLRAAIAKAEGGAK